MRLLPTLFVLLALLALLMLGGCETATSSVGFSVCELPSGAEGCCAINNLCGQRASSGNCVPIIDGTGRMCTEPPATPDSFCAAFDGKVGCCANTGRCGYINDANGCSPVMQGGGKACSDPLEVADPACPADAADNLGCCLPAGTCGHLNPSMKCIGTGTGQTCSNTQAVPDSFCVGMDGSEGCCTASGRCGYVNESNNCVELMGGGGKGCDEPIDTPDPNCPMDTNENLGCCASGGRCGSLNAARKCIGNGTGPSCPGAGTVPDPFCVAYSNRVGCCAASGRCGYIDEQNNCIEISDGGGKGCNEPIEAEDPSCPDDINDNPGCCLLGGVCGFLNPAGKCIGPGGGQLCGGVGGGPDGGP